MEANIIKNDAVKLTAGEDKILRKLKDLYKNCDREVYIYVQQKIGGLAPDFIIIDAKKGISILEIKDWEITYIQDMNKRTVKLLDRDDDNPVFKTRKYLTVVEGLVATMYEDIEDIEDFLYGSAVLTNINTVETEITEMVSFLKSDTIRYVTSENVSKLTLDDIFSKEEINLSSQDIVLLRTMLFPEIKIQKPTVIPEGSKEKPDIFSLNREQESFIRRMPYGPYVVAGLPGSGKTIMLIARAVQLIKEHPDWKVVILTFNKSLCTKLESELNRMASEMAKNPFFRDVPLENITVTTFHKLAKSLVNDNSDTPKDQNWWDYTLPSAALEIARPIYNAVLIDEYQDFLGATRCSMKSAA